MSESLTRAFLFADLRGYTSYIEKRGAVAGAALLDQFRAIVRTAVARYGGAEIRTEGDSFYVVFPSASAAVACALEIVAASTDSTNGKLRVPAGIGVHFGEALPTTEGLVGSAINIAARLAAMAGPGEVLVSDTVRSLMRSLGAALFVRVGRRNLKGVDEPVLVYRAMPAGSTVPRARWSWRGRVSAVAVGLAAFAAIALIAALASPDGLGTPRSVGTSPSSIAGVTARGTQAVTDIPSGGLVRSPASTLGTPHPSTPRGFATKTFAIPFRVDLGAEWRLITDQADLAVFDRTVVPRGWIDVVLVAATLDPPCTTTTPLFIADRPADVIEWLATRPWLSIENPQPYNLGSHVGRAVDIEVLDAANDACEFHSEAMLFRLGSAGDYGSFFPVEVGERKRVISVDVGGRAVTFVVGSNFDDVQQLWAATEPRLQSVQFLIE